jgi:hypothetical protein
MRNAKQETQLRIEADWGNYRISEAEWQKMDGDLSALRKLVEHFPVAELKIQVLHPSDIQISTSLRLPATTLFTADHDRNLHPAWERCVRKLMHKVTAYKERLENKEVYEKEAKGTLHDVRPAMEPDPSEVENAVQDLDYVRFRKALAVYDESLEGRVGRWVQRYPDAQTQLGTQIIISDIVEEVYLNAFERFGERPRIRLGDWLEQLIDPSLQTLLSHPEERENLSYIASAKAADRPA